MHDKLREIEAVKRADVHVAKSTQSLDDLDRLAREQTSPRGFHNALLRSSGETGIGLIAEIKRGSPTRGLIREAFFPAQHAVAYQEGGAACLSVLTDARYFFGQNCDLSTARESCRLPVLRKDFIVDPWQVAEARAVGADAILIIAALNDRGAMEEIEAAAIERCMDVLIELHDACEIEKVSRLKTKLYGINNRDMNTFQIHISNSENLASALPSDVTIVSESGISQGNHLRRLLKHGIHCFLVGESLMEQEDLAAATKRLLS